MISNEFNSNNFKNACEEISILSKKYNDFGGVFDWEYFNAPPDPKKPSSWSKYINNIINK